MQSGRKMPLASLPGHGAMGSAAAWLWPGATGPTALPLQTLVSPGQPPTRGSHCWSPCPCPRCYRHHLALSLSFSGAVKHSWLRGRDEHNFPAASPCGARRREDADQRGGGGGGLDPRSSSRGRGARSFGGLSKHPGGPGGLGGDLAPGWGAGRCCWERSPPEPRPRAGQRGPRTEKKAASRPALSLSHFTEHLSILFAHVLFFWVSQLNFQLPGGLDSKVK